MKPALISIFSLGVVMAGCGGGGGSGSPPVIIPPSNGLQITSANAERASAESWQASNGNSQLVGMMGNSGVIASNPGGVNKAGSNTFAASGLQSIPIPPETLPCAVSGTVTVSGEIADPFTPTLTAGDFIDVDSDNCDDGLGEVLDGFMKMDINGFSGQLLLGTYDLATTLTLTNLQSTTASDVTTLNGGADVTLNTLQLPQVSASVGGTSLTSDTNSGSETLTNFLTTQTIDTGVSPSPYTMNSSGTLDSTQLADVVSFSTPVTFEGFDVDYPHTGEMLVEGDNSSARLVALDNVNVRIDIDNNGDGTIDESINTTWDALSN